MRSSFGWLLALVVSLPAAAATLEDYGPPATGAVKIVRDKFGVPHIIAGDSWSLFYGVGYCQAEDQLENLYVNLLRGQGRAAEREGFNQMIFDHLMRLLNIPQRAQEAYAVLTAEEREHLDAFAAGVNAYIAKNRVQVPDWITPIEPHEIVGFAMYVDTMFCISHCRDDLTRAGIKLVGLESLDRDRESAFGSNQFAVSPQRSASGAAQLSMDPHLPHSGFFRWYEMHLVSPEINVMGACFFGSPYVSMGRTVDTAWCMTVNAPDLGDVFTFEVNPENPQQYKGLAGWQEFEESKETYHVAMPSGATKQTMPCKRTDLGPVIKEQDGVAYVFALPLPEGPSRVRQLYQMAKAHDVQSFRSSLEPLGLAMFNIVYADKAGDIFYISNGRVPKRDTRISSHDLRPGDQEWARWQGFHTIDELPQVLNPKSGYLLNTNSGPQNVTPDEAPRSSDFVPYLMGQEANSRWRRLAELLAGDESIDWSEMHEYAVDTKLEAGTQHKDAIVSLLRAQLDSAGDARDTVAEAADVLERWDLRTDVDSRGAALFFHLWTNDAFVKAVEANEGPTAVKELLEVAADMRKQLGSLDAPWGDFSRIRRGEIEMGIAGCGIHRTRQGNETIGATLRPSGGEVKRGHRYLTAGSSYGMIVDFAGETQAVSCLPYGVSDHPQSPHFADQMSLYVAGKFKPAWFFPADVAANRESEIVLDTRP
ncbi:MAG: penicillin acylase family protein [Pirellulales bacterium]|nr:penicillin acylase family protein [Pirellulales bacterium]